MDLIGLGVLLALVAINATFVAAEFALVTVRRTRIQQLVEEGSMGARVVQQAIHNIDTMIAAIQVGITMVGLAIGAWGEPALASIFHTGLDVLPEEYRWAGAHIVASVISFAAATGITVILGELVPKSIARQHAERAALVLIPPLVVFERIVHPFVWLLSSSGRAVVRLLGLKPTDDTAQHIHTVEELKLLVEASGDAGVLAQDQEEMVERIFDFTLWKAHEVMVPRTQMDAVPLDMPLNALTELTTATRHTRYPVFEGTLDNVVGVIHVKDLLNLIAKGVTPGGFSVRALMQPVLMVPETISANRLLALMRQQRRHIAILVDEYGGTAGLVTLDDLVERIVGEVHGEFETGEEAIAEQPDGTYLIKGMVPIREIEERFDIEVEDEMIDTIGGLVFAELGRQAKVGDNIMFQGIRMEVAGVDGLRIDTVRVRRETQPDGGSDDEARNAGVA